MFAPRSAQADAQPFSLSQYVSSTSTTVCNTNPVITTYHGTVVLNIPITALMAGHEAEIRAASFARRVGSKPGQALQASR